MILRERGRRRNEGSPDGAGFGGTVNNRTTVTILMGLWSAIAGQTVFTVVIPAVVARALRSLFCGSKRARAPRNHDGANQRRKKNEKAVFNRNDPDARPLLRVR